MLKKWEQLPKEMQVPEVKEYYDILSRKKGSLLFKRAFDIVGGTALLVLISPVLAVIAVRIVQESGSPVMFRQERVTQYGKSFRIHKFRTMRNDNSGTQITTDADSRVTKIGQTLRKYRLDELPQLLDIISGNMSFVGTRPEVPEFVSQYTDEMKATLLLPAGVTSEASIQYKDEAELLKNVKDEDVHTFYVEKILPEKMKYNLQSIRNFSCWNDWKTMLKTVGIVAK